MAFKIKCQGYLQKQGGGIKSWKKRWIELRQDGEKQYLYYFGNMEDAKVKNEHKGIVDLTNATLEIKEGVFHITGPNTKRAFAFQADKDSDKMLWMRSLAFLQTAKGIRKTHSINMQPVYPGYTPLINDTNATGFIVEEGTIDAKGNDVKLAMVEDIYARDFLPQRHENYLGVKPAAEDLEILITSVLQVPTGKHYKGLFTNSKGSEEFLMLVDDIPKRNSLSKSFKAYLEAKYPSYRWLHIKHPDFPGELEHVEKKHPQKKEAFKIALLFAQENQKSAPEMFSNTSGSANFEKFLKMMGEKIDLTTWEGYRGDMGREGSTYYTKWNGNDVIFHVSTTMNSEQHRRLIGNDVAAVVFKEAGTVGIADFDLGTVPQVFAVVQPFVRTDLKETGYRMSFFSRTNIRDFPPLVPPDNFFSDAKAKDFLLTKLCNGYATAFLCPPLNRLFFRPRQATIKNLFDKYSKLLSDEKERKQKEFELRQNLALQNSLAPEELKKNLHVHVLGARGLVAADITGTSNPFVEVSVFVSSVLVKKNQTKVQKKTLDPNWNERFQFEFTGVATEKAEVQCVVYSGNTYLGEVQAALSQIRLGKVPMWFSLHCPPTRSEKVTGELYIHFNIKSEKADAVAEPTGPDPFASLPQNPDLITAAYYGREAVVRDLIENKGANPNSVDPITGNSAVHFSSQKSLYMDILRYLVSKGANINARNRQGDTPMHVASEQSRNRQLIELLLELGADPTLLNNKKQSVYWYISEFVSPLFSDDIKAKFIEKGRGRAHTDKRPDKNEEVEFFLKGNKSIKDSIHGKQNAQDVVNQLAAKLNLASIAADLQLIEDLGGKKTPVPPEDSPLLWKSRWTISNVKFVLELKRGSNSNSQMKWREAIYKD